MAKEPTQKAKLALKALELSLTTDVTNDYYLQPKLQKCLTLDDLAREVAALSTRQEDEADLARTGRLLMQRMAWFLSAGYSISTPMGYFRPTAQGVFLDSELNAAPDRSRLKLGVSYSMSDEMRQALADAEIDIEIQKATTGPQLFSVVSTHDAQNPAAVTRGESVPVNAGQTCIIRCKNGKVGGNGSDIGVTITRQDGGTQQSHFFPLEQLFPNTATQVGFVMPATAPKGSVWSVKLCTQLSTNPGRLLKEPRTVTMADFFVVGETVSTNPGGNTGGPDGDLSENPLG